MVGDNRLVDRVRRSLEERNKVIAELYTNQKLKQNATKFILNKGGSKQDAEEIFTDTVVNFVKNCFKADFELKSNIENYFFGVTRNLWFRTLKKRSADKQQIDAITEIDFDDPEILLIDKERHVYLQSLLEKLDEKCKEILTLWAFNNKMKAISETMGYKSPEVARKKKHFCLKKLIALVKKHPSYQEAIKR